VHHGHRLRYRHAMDIRPRRIPSFALSESDCPLAAAETQILQKSAFPRMHPFAIALVAVSHGVQSRRRKVGGVYRTIKAVGRQSPFPPDGDRKGESVSRHHRRRCVV
jgi:hypothetical protein